MLAIQSVRYIHHVVRAEYTLSLERIDEIKAEAARESNALIAGYAANCSALPLLMMGRFAEARTGFETRLPQVPAAAHAIFKHLPLTDGSSWALWYAITLKLLGAAGPAAAALANVRERVTRGGHPESLAYLTTYIAIVPLAEGDWAGLEAAAISAEDHATAHGLEFYAVTARIFRIAADGILRPRSEAAAAVTQAIADYRTMGAWHLPLFLGLLAEVYLADAAPDRAADAVADALAIGIGTGERWFEPEHLRLQAGIMAVLGRHGDAAATKSRAIAAARAAEAGWWLTRAA